MTENGTTRKLGFGFLFALPHKCDHATDAAQRYMPR